MIYNNYLLKFGLLHIGESGTYILCPSSLTLEVVIKWARHGTALHDPWKIVPSRVSCQAGITRFGPARPAGTNTSWTVLLTDKQFLFFLNFIIKKCFKIYCMYKSINIFTNYLGFIVQLSYQPIK